MRMTQYIQLIAALATLCSVLILSGCGESKTAEQYLASAKALEETGDVAAAIVEIKNAIQLEPDSRAARLQLGYLYLSQGDFAGALKELERARSNGGADDKLNRAITRSLIMLGNHEQAATELALNGNFEDAEWQRLEATLDMHVGRYENARDTFQKLLEQEPDDAELRASLVASLLQLNEIPRAKEILNEAIEADVENAGLWIIKAQLAVLDRQYEEAERAYSRALEIKPDAYPAMLGKIVAASGRGNFADAAKLFDTLPGVSENDVRVTYLRGVVAEGSGELEQAINYYRAVIQLHPEHQLSLQKLARLHFQQGEAPRAIEYLERLTALFPNNETYRKQLGAARLAAGRVDSAFEEFEGLSIDLEAQTDANLLALVGSAYSKQGRLSQGVESLQRAYELEPESTPIAIQLALSHLRANESAEAVEVLEAVRTREPDNKTANVLLVLGYANIDPAKSSELLDAQIAASPEEALPLNVRGFLAMQNGEFDKAQDDFEKAISVDPSFLPPYFNRARINIARGETLEAMSELERILAIDDTNSQAYLALGELATRVDKQDMAIRYWEKAREYDPNAGTPRAALARYYRSQGQLIKAQELIEEAFEAAPYQPLVLYEYAQIQLLQGNSDLAQPAIERLRKRFPDSLRVLELEVGLHRLTGNSQAFAETLNQLIELSPESPRPYQMLAANHIRGGQFDKAREVASRVLNETDNTVVGHELLGDINFSERKYEEALADYERGFAIIPSSQLVLKIDQVERRLGRDTNRLEKWYAENPDDRAVRFQLAANTHAEGDIEAAKENFEALLEQNPENPVVLNNLAWIYLEVGDARSLEYAEKANKLLPENPEIMDTYAWILLANGEVEQAIRLLNTAIIKAPNNPDIRFHYAKALVEVGQESQAIEELTAVLGDGKPEFSSMAEAQALLQSLQAGG